MPESNPRKNRQKDEHPTFLLQAKDSEQIIEAKLS